MSCKEGNTFINDDGVETFSSCNNVFKTKNCDCYASDDTNFPNEEQFCGFEQDGFIFPCDVGCCSDGCPGQCPGVFSKPPSAVHDNNQIINTEEKELEKIIATLLLLIFGLIVISTLSLFIKKKA